MTDYLQNRWNTLVSGYSSDSVSMDAVFQQLYACYTEPTRFYHNLNHVQALLELSEELREHIHKPGEIQLAIWFHDAVYDSRRGDNEEASAEVASELLPKLNVDVETMGQVKALILATKTHNATELDDDGKLFLDMDLAILGADAESYARYAQAIREEYAWVEEQAYREGRSGVLSRFLARERVYVSEPMYVRFEERARRNIIAELEALRR